MKISYNWLKQFINTEKTPDEVAGILTGTGLEVESVEKVQAIPGGLEGLVIGFVKECGQHPNADRLRITKVDVGGEADLQVVCGAPNVAAGQKVVVAVVGTTVYPLEGEPFKINKSKIRGEVSEGMICAEDEIGLGHSHAGIMVLPEDVKVGTPAKDYFQLKDDYMLEIGLTPNRADAASHLGVARDLAAFLRTEVVMPDVTGFAIAETDATIPVEVKNSQSCLRYSSVSISGVKVQESPEWLKEKLAVIGIRSVNNIVDVTNYVLHELGQPLHAFDADTLAGKKIVVTNCAEGTPFVTLDGVERKLSAEDLMICDAESPLCIAGVFGGLQSGVTESTVNVFLESAYFNAVSVRKTAKRHGLKTDSSFRFERGTDPNMTVFALKRAALLIQEVAGGIISSEVGDIYPMVIEPFKVSLQYKNVDRLIGESIDPATVREIVKGLGISIVNEVEGGLELSVPPFKVDVTREVDVIEEILRLYGYDNIAIPTQVKASLNYGTKPDRESIQAQVSDMLTANGYYEILSNSLTKSVYSEGSEDAVKVLNPLSGDLDTMRQTLLYSGLEAITYNQNRKNADLKLYEFGRVYATSAEGYKENFHLGVFITGQKQNVQWNQAAAQTTFYNLKAAVDAIVSRLNIQGLKQEACESFEFSQAVQYVKGPKAIVKFGVVAKSILKKLDISKEVFYADFDWDAVMKAIRKNKISYKEVSKFPSVKRDLSLLVDKAVDFATLEILAYKTDSKLIKDVSVFDVYEGDKLPEGKKSYALSFVLQDEEKTLTDKQIESVIDKLVATFSSKAGAEVRK